MLPSRIARRLCQRHLRKALVLRQTSIESLLPTLSPRSHVSVTCFLFSPTGSRSPPPPPGAQPTVKTHTADDNDNDNDNDSGGVVILCPDDGLTSEQRERKRKTEAFLRVVLTTPDEQEWKDMLSAALQHGTWQEHHLQAVLRGVGLLKYDSPALPAASTMGPTTAGGAAKEGPRLLQSSNPTQRLERARSILVFLADEAEVVHHSREKDGETGGTAGGPYKPSESSVHNLLTKLLRGAQRHHSHHSASHKEYGSTTEAETQAIDALPHALYKEVWSFLAWMELHDYHVRSMDLLAELEATVDLDEDAQERTSRVSSTSSSSRLTGGGGEAASAAANESHQPPPLRYAWVSRRVNRLEFIRREREWLQSREAGGRSDGVSPALRTSGRRKPGGGGPPPWRPGMPRTDPDTA